MNASLDRRWIRGLSLLAIALAGAPLLAADEPDPVKENAAKLAKTISVEAAVNDSWQAAPMVEGPVLSYGDPTRNNSNGSVWVWMNAGRPAAIMELYQPTDRPNDWVFVTNNLSGDKVRASRNAKPWWNENESAIEWKSLAEKSGVAPGKPARLQQMKAMAREFAAHEFWDPKNSRFELRLLAQPVYRYADEASGILDGALFAFSNGTNPEVVLVMEARKQGDEASWEYGLARMGHAEMHVSLGSDEVWTVPRVDVLPSNEPYFLDYQTITNIE